MAALALLSGGVPSLAGLRLRGHLVGIILRELGVGLKKQPGAPSLPEGLPVRFSPALSTLDLFSCTPSPTHNVSPASICAGLRPPRDFPRHSRSAQPFPQCCPANELRPFKPTSRLSPSWQLLALCATVEKKPRTKAPRFISFSETPQQPAQRPIHPKIAPESPGRRQCLCRSHAARS